MRIANIPVNEELRLQDLYSYDIMDSEKDKDFDDLLEVAAQIYGCPIAAISFIDKERQWFKATVGMPEDTQETSREVSFCAHTILTNEVLIVGDATTDERFCNNPLVTDGLRIRFYAGAPIVSPAGYRLGAICIVDSEPKELTPGQAKALATISGQIAKLLELRLKNKLLLQTAEEQLRLEKLLLQRALEEHETEKQAISTELHENIAQALAATRFYLDMASEGDTVNVHLVQKSKDIVGALVKQVRELSQAIRPSLMAEVELKDLLTGLLSQFHNQSGLVVELLYEGKKLVAAGLALTVYRVVEKQLANVRQHAAATRVTVNVNVVSSLYLSVKDNGIGFDGKTFRKGGGLNQILSRTEALKGQVEITSGVKGGCELTVMLPL